MRHPRQVGKNFAAKISSIGDLLMMLSEKIGTSYPKNENPVGTPPPLPPLKQS
jgi:hypothetical protein